MRWRWWWMDGWGSVVVGPAMCSDFSTEDVQSTGTVRRVRARGSAKRKQRPSARGWERKAMTMAGAGEGIQGYAIRGLTVIGCPLHRPHLSSGSLEGCPLCAPFASVCVCVWSFVRCPLLPPHPPSSAGSWQCTAAACNTQRNRHMTRCTRSGRTRKDMHALLRVAQTLHSDVPLFVCRKSVDWTTEARARPCRDEANDFDLHTQRLCRARRT